MSSLPPVLIVDDDTDDVFILKRLLAKAGVKNKTVAFEDGRAAVAHLTAAIQSGDKLYLPCLIFSDLNMPHMDGLEFAAWVRAQPSLADTWIVVVSSSEDPKDAARALAAGANKFVLKYPPPSLVKSLAESGGCG